MVALVIALSFTGFAGAEEKKAGEVPAALVGDWFWGNVSPTRYWNRDTGDFVGHGYSGALSYVFNKDGTYQRYFYLETRLYGDVSGLFSASEGTVVFGADGTFTLKPVKGTYKFTEGKRLKRERAMTQDELERPGLVFKWKLEEGEKGKPASLVVTKEGEEPRVFARSKEEK